ncbi:OAM dimerization domain-containing protein [Actinomadura flavalba]|uniref:lysine 5,6-aminomutase subunit beta n=1 Tax=Actinomadura flavalba TaxID=1120938 RepID=UPI000381A5A4|nr:OAM dimerization domain-containing protein [Actinomadura flavalba]
MTETPTGPVVTGAAPAQPADTRQVLRPYGDTTGDGLIQMSFTLPVPAGPRADAAALQLAARMGLEPAGVVHAKAMGPDFTFFIVYGRTRHLIDYAAIPAPPGRAYPLLSAGQVNRAVRAALGRRLVVVGACIGTDAHTVGIDAILNVKGHAGEKGLEYYRELRVVNLGAQVEVDDLLARARAENADAVLISQVVTQRNAHLHNVKRLSAAFHTAYPTAVAAGMGRPLLVAGGPRFDGVTAADLGVDAIFGKGTGPAEVASYLVHALLPDADPGAADTEETP